MSGTRAAFTLDVNKCTGCDACTMACQIKNGLPPELQWREVRTFNELHVPGVEMMHLSMACNHCADAPCMNQCPADAYHRDDLVGAVLIDADKCIGCQYCSWVCPYGAPRFDHGKGVMTKCDFCVDRQHEGKEPACVVSCPTEALRFAHLTESALGGDVPGFARTDIEPAIRITPLRDDRTLPEMTHADALPPWQSLRSQLRSLISLGHEWTLVVFTMICAGQAGGLGAIVRGGGHLDWWMFLGLGIGGLLLSAVHLGKRGRAVRALRGWLRSWVSREVLLFGLFLGAGTALLAWPSWSGASWWFPLPAWASWAVLAVGFAALTAMDRVYIEACKVDRRILHSAQLVGTALLLAGIWDRLWLIAVPVAIVKVVLYLDRKRGLDDAGLGGRAHPVTVVRALLLGAGIWVMLEVGSAPASLLILLGELIDRAEFYHEMEIATPESLMLEELAGRPEAYSIHR